MFSNRRRSLISIGVLCALIASAVFASTATAEVGEWGHEKDHWRVNGATLYEEGEAQPLEFLGLGEYEGSESMDFVWSFLGASTTFSCSKGDAEAELIGPASGVANLTLSGCTMQGEVGLVCSIENEEIHFNRLQFNLSGNTATFSPSRNAYLFFLKIEGPECSGFLSGTHPVSGTFTASLGPEGEGVVNQFAIESSAMRWVGYPLTMRGSLPAKLPGGPEWNVRGIGLLPSGEAESVNCYVGGYNSGEEFVLSGEVGSSRIPTTITATGAECVESSIYNEGEVGMGAGKLKLTGVSVSEPSGCSVKDGTIESNPLHSELQLDIANPETVFDKFEPAPGNVNLAVAHIVGAECSVAGNKALKGSFYGKAFYPLGTEVAVQRLDFSTASEEAATGEVNLEFAGHPAELTGRTESWQSEGREFWMR
ncbi:MAG: hypothetical protein WCD88_16015 [Desulfobacterales bacterium]